MNPEEIKELEQFAKNVLLLIGQDYSKNLGDADDNLCKAKLQENIIVIDDDQEKVKNQFLRKDQSGNTFCHIPLAKNEEDGKIHIFPFMIPSNIEPFQRVHYLEKETLIHQIFHYFIDLNIVSFSKNYVSDPTKEEFIHYLTEGFVEKYARDLAVVHKELFGGYPNNLHNEDVLPEQVRYQGNMNLVQKLLDNCSSEIGKVYKDNMSFQDSYDHMLNFCSSNNGTDIYQIYEKDYLKESDYQRIELFLRNHLNPNLDDIQMNAMMNRLKNTEKPKDHNVATNDNVYEMSEENKAGTKDYVYEIMNHYFQENCPNHNLSDDIYFAVYGKEKGQELKLVPNNNRKGYLEGFIIIVSSMILGIVLGYILIHM